MCPCLSFCHFLPLSARIEHYARFFNLLGCLLIK
nr:MAG TPA: hypothetical protein [Caudoviricetes sp.]